MVREWLHSKNPYQGFKGKPFRGPNWGGADPIFHELVTRVRPSLIIEVGTFYGDSAVTMGKVLKCLDIGGEIVCVDTWLGTMDGMRPEHPDYQWINRRYGFPTIYDGFLANVMEQGLQDVITPFPQTSVNAARAMVKQGVKAQLIYIDAAHEKEDVMQDIREYLPLLAKGGVMFGHDYNHPQVAEAVKEIGPHEYRGDFWILQ